jgi:hypothetical protein
MRRHIIVEKDLGKIENLLNDFGEKKFEGYMGGSGSGNWYRVNKKTLAEHCLSIDVRQLNRKGCLEPWLMYAWKWQNGFCIVIETTPGAIELAYIISRNGQQREWVYIEVPLYWTSCNYGGKRPWFICPENGCGRRVAKLYLEGRYFLCRHCHDLAYFSQRQGKESRLIDKAQKIYQRLGAKCNSDLYSKSKPKGMHQTTYDRLRNEAEELENEASQAACIRFKLFTGKDR